MPDEMQERVDKEKRRLTRMLRTGKTDPELVKALRPIIDNTAWMHVKLEDARAAIRNTQVAIPYDNGGGQKGIRENPAFHGYESLWKSYMLGMGRLLDSIPPKSAEDEKKKLADEAPGTVLDLVMARRRANG